MQDLYQIHESLYYVTPNASTLGSIKTEFMQKISVIEWMSGVDISFWKPPVISLGLTKKRKGIGVYIKGSLTPNDLTLVDALNARFKNNLFFLRYGEHSKSEYKKFLSRIRTLIWFGGTETQGLAMLEAWAMNIPTLIRTPKTGLPKEQFAPMLTPNTGRFFFSFKQLESLLIEMFSCQEKIQPRKWVRMNFSAQVKSRELLFKINDINQVHKRKRNCDKL
jgi:hypothetical protein